MRYIAEKVLKDLEKKMVFLSGPRQVGKTTLSKSFLEHETGEYLNWDFDEDRKRILKSELPRGKALVILDEIHKYSRWRTLIKGYFDKFSPQLKILVTGSGRLDYYSHGGDSLQGRYYMLHLMPFSVKELGITKQDELERLIRLSGFPEPYFGNSEIEKKRWSNSYTQRLVREDLRDLEKVQDLSKIELLASILPQKVSSPLSINSLREDLLTAHQTVQNWLTVLERLYYIFRIQPFSYSKLRAVRKEGKLYLYDWSLVEEAGSRFENFIALHLLKWITYQNEALGTQKKLQYFRDIDKREVDFVITEKDIPLLLIECKLKSKQISPSLKYLKKKLPGIRSVQVVQEPDINYVSLDGIEVISALEFLHEFI
jgi:uncharacterized protein